MLILRRKTRETLRHERAVVRQELAVLPAALVQQDWAANRLRAAELRRAAQARSTGVNTGPSNIHLPVKDAQQNRSQHDGAPMPAGAPAPVEHSLSMQKGGDSDAPRMGLVIGGKSLAGGKGTPSAAQICNLCEEPTGGHYGWCPTIS